MHPIGITNHTKQGLDVRPCKVPQIVLVTATAPTAPRTAPRTAPALRSRLPEQVHGLVEDHVLAKPQRTPRRSLLKVSKFSVLSIGQNVDGRTYVTLQSALVGRTDGGRAVLPIVPCDGVRDQ